MNIFNLDLIVKKWEISVSVSNLQHQGQAQIIKEEEIKISKIRAKIVASNLDKVKDSENQDKDKTSEDLGRDKVKENLDKGKVSENLDKGKMNENL